MKSFIKQTAKDYDLQYSLVKDYYNWYWEEGSFYQMLEAHLNFLSNKTENKI